MVITATLAESLNISKTDNEKIISMIKEMRRSKSRTELYDWMNQKIGNEVSFMILQRISSQAYRDSKLSCMLNCNKIQFQHASRVLFQDLNLFRNEMLDAFWNLDAN